MHVGQDTGVPARLGFTFRFAGGAGKLALEELSFFGWLRVERLELDVPGLSLPVDLSAGPEIFQRHRTRVRLASMRIDTLDLNRFITTRVGTLAELGVDQLEVRTGDGYLAAECRVREGPHVADLTFRVSPARGDDRVSLRLVVHDARVYGFLPTPAPLVAHRITAAILGAGGDDNPARVEGLGLFTIAPLRTFLWNTLPPAGWRLPATGTVGVALARVTRTALQLSYTPLADEEEIPPLAGDDEVARRAAYREADERLRAGDIPGTIRAYRAELASGGPEQTFVVERLLAVAAAQPTFFVDAVELSRQTLGRRPDFAPAHAALASIAIGEDDWVAAAARYRTLSDLAEAAGDELGAVRAALTAARLMRTVDPPESTPLYDRVLAHRPRHAEAAEALSERYAAEDRWHELARLIRGRLGASADAVQRSRDHLRLASILRDHLDDPDGARAELTLACELDPQHVAALEELAALELALGEPDRASDALDRAAELLARRGDDRGGARALAGAGDAALAAGDSNGAERRYRRALELDPDSEAALSGAASVLEQRGAVDEAVALWHRLIDASVSTPARQARYSCELGRSLLARGDIAGARAALSGAADADDAELRARARALLADAHEAAADRDAAAAELADAVGALVSAAERAEAVRAVNLRRRAAELTLARGRHLVGSAHPEDAAQAFELAHSLAESDAPEVAREAATELLRAADADNDLPAAQRWIDALLALAGDDAERAALLLHRAEEALAADRTDDALRDIDAAAQLDTSGELRGHILGTRAAALAAADDHAGQARALHTLAENADGLAALEAETGAARAWLEASEAAAALDAARRAVAMSYQLDEVDADTTRAIDGAHDALADAAWRKRAWDDVARGYERLADAPCDSAGRARRLARYGVALRALDRRDPARDALTRALDEEDAAPDIRTEAARELSELLQTGGDPAGAAAVLEQMASDEEAGSENARADAWYRAGDLYAQDDASRADAERCLEASLRLVPDHMPALDALERIKRADGDLDRVAVILGRKIAATARHPGRQKALLVRLAEVQGHELERADAAREAYLRALEIDPDYRPALRLSAADAEAEGDLELATELYARLSLALPGDDELPDDATSLTDERYLALQALARLAEARDDEIDLADALARLAAATHARGDIAEAERLRREVDRLSHGDEQPLGEPPAGDELVAEARALEADERDRAAVDLLERARAAGSLPEDAAVLLATLQRECERKAELAASLERDADDAEAMDALPALRKALHLYEHSLGDVDAAQRVRARMKQVAAEYDEGASPHPSAPPQAGEGEVDDAIAEEIALGQTMESEGREDAAIARYEEAAMLAPEDRRPLEALERLYGARDDAEALSEVLGRMVVLQTDPLQRGQLWRRRARLYRDALHREAETYRCLKEAYACAPNSGEIANELRSVAMVRGEWALAAELLYAEIAAAANPREAGALHHELALIFDEKLLDPDGARLNYEQALALDPEIPAAPEPLARLYELAGDLNAAGHMHELAAERARSEDDRGRCYQRAALCAERVGDEIEARRLYNLAALAVSDDDNSRRAHAALARLSAAAQGPISQNELFELRLSEETDNERRIDLLREMLESAVATGDERSTVRYAEILLAADPSDASAYRELRDRAAANGDWDALANLQELRASATDDPLDRSARYYELGRLYLDRLRDVNAAVTAFEQALESQPDHAGAVEALAAIAYGKADWARARALYVRLAPESATMARDALWLRRGEVAEAMGLEREALDAFLTAVEHGQSNRTALAAVARTASRLGDHRRAREALETLVDLLPLGDVKGVGLARLQLGELSRKLGEHGRAIDYYERVLAEDPESQKALEALVDLYGERGDYASVVRTLSTLTALAPTPAQRAELLYRCGEIYRVQIGDADLAGDSYLKGIDLDPAHVPTLRRLIDYYWRIEDDAGLVEIARDLDAQRALPGTDPLPLARGLVAAGVRGNATLARAIASTLASETAEALAATLAEASRDRPADALDDLAGAALRLCAAIEGLSADDLATRAARRGATEALTARLRSAH